ncbi:MAG: hypothetical protein GF418_17595 [Chitinivibrionales bacterium]|nr:hypothetical protein [Chitinivibrionales bacterium]MBD3397436.1 hypothetical protein [Chitinivibrionales bacterium]
MPELPDVELCKEYFETTARDKRIQHVEVRDARVIKGISVPKLRQRLEKKRITSACRHGKHLLAHIEKDGFLVLHFGMTGFLQLVEKGEEQPRHTRVLFRFPAGGSLAYSCMRLLGKVSWTEDLHAYRAKERLGPDALGMDHAAFAEMLRESRGAVKPTLMDQSRIAGLGNIYTDEILFQSGVHPGVSSKKLSGNHIRKMHRALKRICTVAIRHKANPHDLPRGYLLPHRRKGAQCPRCGGNVKSASVGGRTAYFCSQCQKKL